MREYRIEENLPIIKTEVSQHSDSANTENLLYTKHNGQCDENTVTCNLDHL